MIELFEEELKTNDRHSSKGNQLKWQNGSTWYKADALGYEGLAEYVISQLLCKSTLEENEFVCYSLEQIHYKETILTGCSSPDFLTEDWQIITLQRLYQNAYGRNLLTDVWHLEGYENRLLYLTEQMEKITGLKNFGIYLCKLLTIDAMFLNEDRHMHNIAVLMNGRGQFQLCPIFDHGAALLSDCKMDYPLSSDTLQLMGEVKAKTICTAFDDQLDAAEKLFGYHLKFTYTRKDIDAVLNSADIYDRAVIERVRTLLYQQMRKYGYLFDK